MTLGEKITAARKAKGLRQDELARKVGMTGASMSGYENDQLQRGPDPRTLIRISEALESPEILIHHCDSCPVRQHIMLRQFPELNQVNPDPSAIALRLQREGKEMVEALDKFMEMLTNKDFKKRPGYQDTFKHAMDQIIDVERAIEILKFQLMLAKIHTPDEIRECYDAQQKKCIEKGYHTQAGTGTEG